MRSPTGQASLRPAAAVLVALAVAAAAPCALSAASIPRKSVSPNAVVGYDSPAALRAALRRFPARIVRRIPELNVAEVRPVQSPRAFAASVAGLPGIHFVGQAAPRASAGEPALIAPFRPGVPYEWQYPATRAHTVPEHVLRAAAAITIAVVDTGADLTAPDLAAKSPAAFNLFDQSADVRDWHGHGTFVASLAAGSVSNSEGIAGFGGDAKLLVVKAGRADGSFTDVDEAAAIVYAVNHGAKVINLSIGGTETSATERKAVEYAAEHSALLVAAAGNEFEDGNPIEYPAALLQPPGSMGRGGTGLSVGASTRAGKRAYFSNTGSHVSLAAPGENVFGAVSSYSKPRFWPRYPLPGSSAGLYGWSSGTSFATPQVVGAAALVWAANPALTMREVAGILKLTASGNGSWNKALGYGVLDVGRAVATAANGGTVVPPSRAPAALRLLGARKRLARRARVRIRAVLRSRLPAISPAARLVTLQAWRRGAWRRLARKRTKASGKITWRVTLRRGRYRLRVRYAGSAQLTSAASRAVTIKVRPRKRGRR